ncbi:MAG: hypothetical protein RL653_4475 [Pseudomonadota bacterium]|jgi:hypothetical protein
MSPLPPLDQRSGVPTREKHPQDDPRTECRAPLQRQAYPVATAVQVYGKLHFRPFQLSPGSHGEAQVHGESESWPVHIRDWVHDLLEQEEPRPPGDGPVTGPQPGMQTYPGATCMHPSVGSQEATPEEHLLRHR